METRSSKGVSSICSYCRESVPSGLLSHHVRLECPVAVSKKGIYCAICDQKYVNYARHLDLPRHRCRLAAVNLSKASAEITPGLDQARIRWKTEFYAAYSGLPGCSFTYPNLDTEDAWPEQIRFLGPPSDQCTSLYEHEHTPTKCIGTRHSNQREIEKTILGKRDREVFCAIDGSVVLHGADDVQPVKKPRPPALASGFRAIGKPQTVALSDAILDIIRPVLLRIGCGPCAGVQRFEGWTLGAVRARTGAFLKYESRAGDAAKQYALLLGVYRCRLKGIAKSVVLAYVQKFEHVGEQRPCVRARHSFPILQPAHSELIALGFPFFKINKLISVVRHPLRPGMYLYNNRIRNELVVSDSGTTDLVAAVADSGSDDDVDDSDVDG
eukprot:TRINITY_DN210_c0_g1_i20.p1 TRINITY_DN210_c0_g1~~TRINITY_DN210_c0_g1_i20.p1  ORF type:complete len:383 (+),score=40.66 TRINITY_DN210_c0_g1_i20:1487-2635(+)